MTKNARPSHPSAASFANAISAEALESSAVNHPYLQAMREGDFPNVELAFKDFALQYGFYSGNFTRYVLAVIDNLHNAEHKKILQGNLAEEQGDVHDVELPPDVLASVTGRPHSELYRRFQNALGVSPDEIEPGTEGPGLQWSQQFLELCETNECVGVGAIGIGTEFIVARIFNQILEALDAHSHLTMTQRVFFDLHSECDEKHAAEMLSITQGLALDKSSCDDIAYGVRTALNMRAAFWDAMLERAQRLPAASSHAVEEPSPVGHQENL